MEMAGTRGTSGTAGPSVFLSLVPLADHNTKSHLAVLESRLDLGQPTAFLNEHLRAEELAARQRTADWAAQRRKAGKETSLSDVQRGKRRRIEAGWTDGTRDTIEVPQSERPAGQSALQARTSAKCELISGVATLHRLSLRRTDFW